MRHTIRAEPIVRPATQADLESFYVGKPARPTVTAVVGELNGKLIAIGGIAHVAGDLVGFFDIKPEARKYPLKIVKTARKILDDMRSGGATVIHCTRDPDEPRAGRFLEYLGFRPVGGMAGKYIWLASRR